MHTDTNIEMLEEQEAADFAVDSYDGEIGWLLEMDLSEPQEKLFAVEQPIGFDTSLSEYELAVARRPMTRGSVGADDLETYVDEEIVISSDTSGGDIYTCNSPASTSRTIPESQESMAIDFSRSSQAITAEPQAEFKDGLDILGLADNDDMGEKFLVIRRPGTTIGGETLNAAPAGTLGGEATAEKAPEQPMFLSEAPVLRLVKTAELQVVANDPVAVVTTIGAGFDSLEVEGIGFDSTVDSLSAAVNVQSDSSLFGADDVHSGYADQHNMEPVLAAGEEGFDLPTAVSTAFCDLMPEQVDSLMATDAIDATDATDALTLSDDTLLASETIDSGTTQWRIDDNDIDDIFASFGESENVPTGDAFSGSVAESALAELLDSESFDIFSEDFFADENSPAPVLMAEAATSTETPQADIDELFESLGLESVEADEICGVDVGEFSAAGGHLQLVPQPQVNFMEQSAPEFAATGGGDFSCIPGGIVFAQASLGGGEIFADFLDAFVEEGSAELEKLEDAVARWEKDLSSDDGYAAVSRILHTVKGIAKGVGLQFYGTLIHNFETLLSALPRPVIGAEGHYFRVVNAWLDACVRGLDHIQDSRGDIPNTLPQSATQAPVEAMQAAPLAVEAAPQPAAQAPTSQPVVEAVDARARQLSKKMADEGARALAAQQSVRITSEKLDHLLNLSNQAQQLSVRTAQSVTRGKRTSGEMQSRLASLRAHITAIADRALRSVAAKGVQHGASMDALEMDQYSELQEAANILREGVEDLADLVDFATRQNTQVEALLKQQTRVISSIGSAIRSARVVPVSRLIPGLRRLVRTLSGDLDKTVSFQVLNELGTLDRDDYARCQTILDHMVRNALDHGIEQAAERAAAGKPAEGLVTIDIRKAGADSVITLTDDGRGIDPEKMRESAISKGIDVDVDALTDAEAIRLVFHKGFSTASAISQISGRGVGMDIVLNELQEMGGDIQIDSVPGRGTAFHIRVPSSITVNGALLVSAGEHSYAIPLGGLVAVEQVPVAEFFAAVHDNTRITVSGMECEPAYLAALCHTGHALDAKTWRTSVPVIVAGSSERYMAIAIDDVEEALELVIRSLGPQFSTVPGVAGAATTAAGEAIVALDLNLLVASVPTDGKSAVCVDAPRDETLLVMVVDDSRTQRMVATSQLETVGVETITAENGAVAIDLLNTAERLPDIILMDVEMPVKDGIQALREIRKSVRYGHIPVIMITSRTGLKHRAMAQAAGCNGYMGKPFNFRMLIGQVNELTGYRLELS